MAMNMGAGSLRSAIREIIWKLDPAGVSEDRRLIPDEYDAVVEIGVHRYLGQGAAAAAALMASTFEEKWGLDVDERQFLLLLNELADPDR